MHIVEIYELSSSPTSRQKKEAHPGDGYVFPGIILLSDASLPLHITIRGSIVGDIVGISVGSRRIGISVGPCDGSAKGALVGLRDFEGIGAFVGSIVGYMVGTANGSMVGRARGLIEGLGVGSKDGTGVGSIIGFFVGSAVGWMNGLGVGSVTGD